MHDSYVDGFCLKLENILDREKIKEVANLLYIYSIDYEIKPIKNNIIIFPNTCGIVPAIFWSFYRLVP